MKYYRIKISHDDDPMNPREGGCDPGTLWCWHSRYNLGDENPHKNEDPETAVKSLVGEFNPDFAEEAEAWFEERYSKLKPLYLGTLTREEKQAHKDLLQALADKWSEEFEKHYLALPVYLMDHGGISMSTGSFGDPWDSGQVGFIFISKKKALETWEYKEWCPKVEAKAKACLKEEVKIYDQFLTGDVYGFQIECYDMCFEQVAPEDVCWDSVEWESVDSCWGFFGADIEHSGMWDAILGDAVDGGEWLEPFAQEAMDNVGEWVNCFKLEEATA